MRNKHPPDAGDVVEFGGGTEIAVMGPVHGDPFTRGCIMKKAMKTIMAALAIVCANAKAEVLTEVSSAEGGYYTLVDAKTFTGVSLPYVKSVKATVLSSYGTYATEQQILTDLRSPIDNAQGIYYWQNDGAIVTAQLQWKTSGYLRGLQIKLQQSGSDVLATVIGHYYPAYDPYGTDFRTKSFGGTFLSAYFGDENKDTCPLALADLKLIVSDEPQIEIDTQWDGAGSGVVAGDKLVWDGGASGTWDGTTTNWTTVGGAPIRWVRGCVAKFTNTAAVAVSGFKNVAGVEVGPGTVTLTGSEIRVTGSSAIKYNENGTLRVEGSLVGTANISVFARGNIDTLFAGENGYLPSGEANAIKLFSGRNVADMNTFKVVINYKFGAYAAQLITLERVADDATTPGISRLVNDGTTCSFQCKVNSGYYGNPYAIKIVLKQVGDDVYGYVAKANMIEYQPWTYDLEAWNASQNPITIQLSTPTGDTPTRQCAITSVTLLDRDPAPTNCVTEIAGIYNVVGALLVSNSVFKTVGQGILGASGTFAQPTVVSGGALELTATTAQTMARAITTANGGHVDAAVGSNVRFTSNADASWDLRISGDAYATGYSTLPTDGAGTTVMPGGVLRMGDFYGYWGPNSAGGPITVLTNGVVRLTKAGNIGCSKPYYLQGGAITNETSTDNLVYKLYMRDGATFTGKGVGVGFQQYYNAWSFIDVGGSTPSSFAAETMMVGFQVPAGKDKPVGVKLIVADVTGSDATDFTLASRLTEKTGVTLYDEGYRTNLGLWKQGAGTLELTGADSSCTTGVFKVEAGTVRLGATASGALGAFILLGDGAIDCAGGKMAFADSRDMVWTAEKTLTVSGELGAKTIRFGTDANALTADQLAQIKKPDSSALAWLSTEGYLRIGQTPTVFLVK